MNESARRRALVLAGSCPWCGRDGFLSIAKHTQATHGIDRRALREAIGLPWTARICSPEVSERRREINKTTGRSERLRDLRPPAGRRSVSPAGRQVLARNGAMPKPRPGRSPIIAPGVRQQVHDLRTKGWTYVAIAARVGMSASTAHRIVNGRAKR